MLKATEVSARAREFRNQHADLPLSEKGSALIHLVEEGSRLKVMIEVDEDATHRSLRAALPLALTWQHHLLRQQGPDPGRPDNRRLELCQMLHVKRQFTYAQLADNENTQVANLIREGDEANLNGARVILRTFGLGSNEIEMVIHSARYRLTKGLAPFEPGQPIRPDRICSALKTWRNRKQRLGVTHLYPDSDEDPALRQLPCALRDSSATCQLENQNLQSA